MICKLEFALLKPNQPRSTENVACQWQLYMAGDEMLEVNFGI